MKAVIIFTAVPEESRGIIPWPLGVVLALIGLGCLLVPGVAFQYLDGWKFRDPETRPSWVYASIIRIAGLALIFFGIHIFYFLHS